MTQKRPERYEDVETLEQVNNRGEIDMVFLSDRFWFGRCFDDGCQNLHVLLCEEGKNVFEVGATFTCEQLEDLLETAKVIRRGPRKH